MHRNTTESNSNTYLSIIKLGKIYIWWQRFNFENLGNITELVLQNYLHYNRIETKTMEYFLFGV